MPAPGQQGRRSFALCSSSGATCRQHAVPARQPAREGRPSCRMEVFCYGLPFLLGNGASQQPSLGDFLDQDRACRLDARARARGANSICLCGRADRGGVPVLRALRGALEYARAVDRLPAAAPRQHALQRAADFPVVHEPAERRPQPGGAWPQGDTRTPLPRATLRRVKRHLRDGGPQGPPFSFWGARRATFSPRAGAGIRGRTWLSRMPGTRPIRFPLRCGPRTCHAARVLVGQGDGFACPRMCGTPII